MGWDGHKLLWDGTDKYVPCTTLQKPPHHFLQTLHPLRMLKIVFRDSWLYPKQLSLFCLLRLISASA